MNTTTSKAKTLFFQISAILILLGAIIFYFHPDIAKYVVAIGVAGYGATVFTTPYPGKNLTGKRVFNLQVLSVILMAVSAYLMFINKSEWVLLLLLATVLTLVSYVALSKIYEKEKKAEK